MRQTYYNVETCPYLTDKSKIIPIIKKKFQPFSKESKK